MEYPGFVGKNTFSRQRYRLWIKNPFCYYCGVETIYRSNKKIEPANFATIEHLNSRLKKNRRKPNEQNERRRVIACKKCNGERSAIECATVPIEALRERSRLHRKSWFEKEQVLEKSRQ